MMFGSAGDQHVQANDAGVVEIYLAIQDTDGSCAYVSLQCKPGIQAVERS